ncbi:MAG: AAA family ATPase [Candidatus Rokubacteria bacterium]|nr:AAA family ATPase [Candidatus Rokubacteria bacterium]
MQCLRCHTENPPQAKFCLECATPLAQTCAKCGTGLPPVAKFCPECAHPVGARPATQAPFTSPESYTPKHLAEKILASRSVLEGERKQVTVLFVDVSEFTALSEKLDPEEVHQLMNRAFELMLTEVHRYEGTVNQFLGDGIMALFGAPIAHEDHAQRAVHAALGIRQRLQTYEQELRAKRDIEFRARIGLNTGLVVVGAIGDNLRMDYTAVGDTTNLAARMQQLAEPGQVVMAEATHRMVRAYFHTRPLGTVTVKNRKEPVAAYAVERARGVLTRLEAQAESGLTPLVGRDQELATLERAFRLAKEGRGQVVFVVGEAGMGKSRLLLEFRKRLAGEAVTWLEGHCISFGQSIAHLPVIEMLKRNFRVEEGDSEARIIEKIDRGLAFLGDDAAVVAPFLKYLLSVDPGDPAVVSMDPLARRSRIFEALRQLTLRGSRLRPIVMVIEDLHWLDQASEEYLKYVAESLAGAPVLLVLTYRPGYAQPLGDRTYYSRIVLQPLSEDETVRMAREFLEAADMPAEIRALIARKAEGNPFFLEELMRSLVETGALRRDNGRYVMAGSAHDLLVPDTINDLLMARIDRLAEQQKRIIQVASVIGREFALGLLRRVSEIPEHLEPGLTALKRLELIYEKAVFPESEYVFRHALAQEVAYASMLQTERRRLHGRIGAGIEEVYAGRLDERPEELAYHFNRGEVWEKAVHYSREAAERAAALCLDSKAVEFYQQGLDALGRLPDTPDAARLGLDIRFAMRAPLWRAGRLDRLFELFKEAESLATRLGDTDRLETIYAFLVQYYWAKAQHQLAIEYGQRCLEAAEARDNLGLRVTGNFYLGHVHHALGQFRRAIDYLTRNLELLEGKHAFERFGLSGLAYSGSCALTARCLTELGEPERARELIDRGEKVANAADHLYSKVALGVARGELLVHHGTPAEAIAVLEPTLATCREKGFAGQTMYAATALGLAYGRAGRPADGIPLVQDAIRLQEKAAALVERGYWWQALGQLYLADGRLDEAQAAADESMKFAREHAERWVEGWSEWLLGEIAGRRGNADAARRHLDAASAIASALELHPLADHCRASRERRSR